MYPEGRRPISDGKRISSGRRESDFTKSRTYATVDLIAKLTSAIGLVTIGIVGSCFQIQSDRTHRAETARQLEEQLYLPELRSLVTLDNQLRAYQENAKSIDSARHSASLDKLRRDFRYAAYGVYFPCDDRWVAVHSVRAMTRPSFGDEVLCMPLRATAVMYADVVRRRELLADKRFIDGDLEFDPKFQGYVRVIVDHKQVLRFTVTPDAIPAWQILLQQKALSVRQLLDPRFSVLPIDIRFGLAQVIHQTITEHPGLGADYVKMLEEQRSVKGSATTD